MLNIGALKKRRRRKEHYCGAKLYYLAWDSPHYKIESLASKNSFKLQHTVVICYLRPVSLNATMMHRHMNLKTTVGEMEAHLPTLIYYCFFQMSNVPSTEANTEHTRQFYLKEINLSVSYMLTMLGTFHTKRRGEF